MKNKTEGIKEDIRQGKEYEVIVLKWGTTIQYVKKEKEHDISISSFLDIELWRYLAFIEEKSINDTLDSKSQNIKRTDNHGSSGAYGLAVMTSPSHGGGRRFESG